MLYVGERDIESKRVCYVFVYVCLGVFVLPYKHMHYKNYKPGKGLMAIL